jgi:uncharacterized cupin superfamily protein
MERQAFMRELQEAGFPEPQPMSREANGHQDEHTHEFEIRALVLQGQITIGVRGVQNTYRAGDVFHLTAHTAHTERYGPQGVMYLAGRKG